MADSRRSPKSTWFIKDARGRRVRQLDPVAMHLTRQRGSVEPDALRAIAKDVGIGLTRAGRWFLVAYVLLAAVVTVVRIVELALFAGPADIMTRETFTVLQMWGIGVAFLIGARVARSRRNAKVMLRHRHCPHCGYDLTGLPVDDADGSTICPECGCAWALPAG